MLTKPYDEVHIPCLELKKISNGVVRVEKMKEWLKFELQADELELFEDADTMNYVVRYKRNQLQYG